MIERIARRAGGFASTTALRWLASLGDSVSEVDLPMTKKQSPVERLVEPLSKGVLGGAAAKGALTKGALAGAFALISSNKVVRRSIADGLDKIADSMRTDSSSKRGSSSAQKSSGGSSSAGSNGHSSSNGSAKAALEKTRTELYEMAKKLDIPGRSSMTKEQLEKALKKN